MSVFSASQGFERLKARFVSAGNITRLAVGAEQVVYALVSMVTLIILSRVMDIEAFGVFATTLGIWLVIESIHLGVIVKPMIVTCPALDRRQDALGAWAALNSLFATIVSAACLLAGFAAAGLNESLSLSLYLLAPVSFAGIHYAFTRRVLYHLTSIRRIIFQVIVYATVYLAAQLVAVCLEIDVTPLLAAGMLSLAFAVPVLVGIGPIISRTKLDAANWRKMADARGLIASTTLVDIMWPVLNTTAIVTLNLLAGPASVALFTIARTIARPVTLIASTIGSVDASLASRKWHQGGIEKLKSVTEGSWAALLVLTLPLIAALLVLPEIPLHLIYGGDYDEAANALRLWAIIAALTMLAMPVGNFLTVTRDFRRLLQSNLLGVASGLTAIAVFVLLNRLSAETVLLSLAVARLGVLPALLCHYRAVTRLHKSAARVVADGEALT